jgi:hypothetical protein
MMVMEIWLLRIWRIPSTQSSSMFQDTFMKLSSLVLLLLLTASKPGQAKLTASPRVCVAPCKVHMVVRIPEPSSEMYCPLVEWLLPDGVTHSHQADCPPWEDQMSDDPFMEQGWITLPEGSWELGVRLSQGKKSLLLKENVEVR